MKSTKPIETLEVQNRQEWRKWLKEHFDSTSEIWLVFHKRHTGVPSIGYDDAVEEGAVLRMDRPGRRPVRAEVHPA